MNGCGGQERGHYVIVVPSLHHHWINTAGSRGKVGEVGEDKVWARHGIVVVIIEVVGSTLHAQRLCEWMSKHHCCFFSLSPTHLYLSSCGRGQGTT